MSIQDYWPFDMPEEKPKDTEVTPVLFETPVDPYKDLPRPHNCYVCNVNIVQYPENCVNLSYGMGKTGAYVMAICAHCMHAYCKPKKY